MLAILLFGITISYLFGAIPTAYLFVKLIKKTDIRKLGSGNVGATNASRVLGKKLGILVLLLDMLKGIIPTVFLPGLLFGNSMPLQIDSIRISFGISAIVGHIWTVFLNFKGGKGVATMLGVLMGLALKIPGVNFVLISVLATWLIVFIFSRIISLASLVAAFSLPLYMFLFAKNLGFVYLSLIVSALIILRHKPNLIRLLKGQEPRYSFKKQ